MRRITSKTAQTMELIRALAPWQSPHVKHPTLVVPRSAFERAMKMMTKESEGVGPFDGGLFFQLCD